MPTVGDKGALPSSLPVPGLPDVPFTLEALTAIAPYAFAMALVGLMESLMAAELVDEITDAHSSKTRVAVMVMVSSGAPPPSPPWTPSRPSTPSAARPWRSPA
ncbi:hypothetical protein AMK24_14250 [Streptomyces sp. CB02366]|nr:hypothetical protein AMK24_14250 [Streptomyces sp. CB02366]TVP35769.1 hypothetical protein A3L22_06080 [Streptomyces griseus subsp. griseus]